MGVNPFLKPFKLARKAQRKQQYVTVICHWIPDADHPDNGFWLGSLEIDGEYKMVMDNHTVRSSMTRLLSKTNADKA